MTTVLVMMDGGYSDRSVEAIFSTREKATAFLKRFYSSEIEEDVANRMLSEVVLDAYDDAGWPPGMSWRLTMRVRACEPNPCFVDRVMPVRADKVVMLPQECTGIWKADGAPWENVQRCFFWGTEEAVMAFADAKLAEEMAKLPADRRPDIGGWKQRFW